MTDFNIHLGIDWKVFTLGVLFLGERATVIWRRLKLSQSDWVEHSIRKEGGSVR